MDISEAIKSQEIAGVSPMIENKIVSKKEIKNMTTSLLHHESLISPSYSNNMKEKQNDDGNNILKLDNMHLDNDPKNVLSLVQQQQQQQQNYNLFRTSEMKIANSHPLMSPPGTDSDSENRIFSYPDVVPKNEPLRLAASTNRLNEKENKQNLDVTADCKKLAEKIENTATTNALKTAETTTTITGNSYNSSNKRKIPVRRESSPDLISSESDQEISQYQASVEPNYQTVALKSNNLCTSRISKTTSPQKPLTRRKIPISSDLLSNDDMSSLDSISNHSFDDDDDMDHNLASLSPSSSVLDGGFNDKYDDFLDIETPTNPPPDPIPTYTLEDERRDSRNWQKITLPDGRVREIDMKVIEPYKRVLSHGGYLKAGGHNAIVMFCACHLPDRSRTDYHYVMDNLFLYVVKTLEQLVTEDYVLVYLHGGSSRRNIPPFPWLKSVINL